MKWAGGLRDAIHVNGQCAKLRICLVVDIHRSNVTMGWSEEVKRLLSRTKCNKSEDLCSFQDDLLVVVVGALL